MQIKMIRGVTFGKGMPKICAPLMGSTEEEILEAAPKLLKSEIDVIEWRVDHFNQGKNAKAVCAVLAKLRLIFTKKVLLLTFRTSNEGGEQSITLDQYQTLLLAVAQSGYVDLIDVEGCFPEMSSTNLVDNLRENNVSVIVSNHNFDYTPSEKDLLARLITLEQLQGDFVKLAVMPKNDNDVAALLSATKNYTRRSGAKLAITMSMGGLGVRSRICGEEVGSVLTFGAVGQVSAPGQLEVADLYQKLTEEHQKFIKE